MRDRSVSSTITASTLLWVAGIALAVVYCLFGIRGTGILSLLIAGGGGVLTIRCFLVSLADTLLERERNAFELGQDAGRMRPVR